MADTTSHATGAEVHPIGRYETSVDRSPIFTPQANPGMKRTYPDSFAELVDRWRSADAADDEAYAERCQIEAASPAPARDSPELKRADQELRARTAENKALRHRIASTPARDPFEALLKVEIAASCYSSNEDIAKELDDVLRQGQANDHTLILSAMRDAARLVPMLSRRLHGSDADLIVTLQQKAMELYRRAEGDDTSNDEMEIHLESMNRVILAGTVFPPTTLPGAFVALEWARHQLLEMNMQRGSDTPYDQAIVSMLDGAISVFRGAFSDGRAVPCLAPHTTGDLPVLQAVVELQRVDALQNRLCAQYRCDTDEIPGYAETEVAWDAAFRGVADTPATGWAGVVAKASVLKINSVWHDTDRTDEVANSLAEDVLRMAGRSWDPELSRDATALPKRKPDGAARPGEERAA